MSSHPACSDSSLSASGLERPWCRAVEQGLERMGRNDKASPQAQGGQRADAGELVRRWPRDAKNVSSLRHGDGRSASVYRAVGPLRRIVCCSVCHAHLWPAVSGDWDTRTRTFARSTCSTGPNSNAQEGNPQRSRRGGSRARQVAKTLRREISHLRRVMGDSGVESPKAGPAGPAEAPMCQVVGVGCWSGRRNGDGSRWAVSGSYEVIPVSGGSGWSTVLQ